MNKHTNEEPQNPQAQPDGVTHHDDGQEFIADCRMFQGMFESAPIGMAQTDPSTGRWVRVNAQMCKITGYSAQEMLALRVPDITHPEDRERDWAAYLQVVRGDAPNYHLEKRYIRKDGTVVWVNVNMTVLRDEAGRPVRTMAIIEDISERKRLETALRESNEIFSRFIRHSPIFAYIKSVTPTESRVLQASDNFEQMIGISGRDMIGKPMEELFPADFAAKMTADDWDVAVKGQDMRLDEDFNGRNYTTVKFPIVLGDKTMLAGYTIDITDHKRAEDALREGEKRYRSFVEASSQVVWTTNARGEVDMAIPAWQAYTGQSEEEARGFGWMDAIAPEDREQVAGAWARAHDSNGIYEVEYRLRRHDGVWRNILARGVPVRNDAGDVQEYMGTCTDITERKQFEEAVQRSEEWHRSIIQTALSGFYLTDLQGRLLEVNQAYCRMSGYDEAELLAMGIGDLEALETPEEVARRIQKIITRGWDRFESRHRRKDGSLFETEISVRFLPEAGGRMVSFIEDITELNRAFKDLTTLSQRLQLATTSAKLGIWDWNVPLSNMVWDDRMLDLYGITRETFRDSVDTWKNSLHPEDRERTIAECRVALSGEREFDTEFRVLHPDGAVKHIKANGLVIRDADGSPERMIGTNADITERKRAEAALRESEERFKLSMEATHDGLWDWNAETDDVYFSPSYYRILGYEPGDFPGSIEAWKRMIHPDDLERAVTVNMDCVEGRSESFVVEYRMKARTGEWRWILGRGKCITHDAQGRATRLIGTHVDITERKQAEALLQREQDLYKDLVNTIAIGTYRLRMRPTAEQNEENGRNPEESPYAVEMVSDRFFEITGISQQEFTANARCVLDRIHPDDIPEFLRRNAEVVDSRSLFRWEGRMVLPDGRTIWVHLESIPRLLENGEVMWTGIVYDITERKRSEEEREKLQAQLLQAQKMESVGRLAGGVAHDFNNMLGVILGHTEMALEQVQPSQPLYDDLAEIQKAAQRSADLTRQLLAFARKQTIAPRDLDLNETIAGMLKMLQRIIGENINLTWEPGVNLWPVKMDPSQLDQILANLCVNARDAIANIGRITIKTENTILGQDFQSHHPGCQSGEYVRLTVSDNGCGMDKETLAHIFEPFFTTKGVGAGTGLGLATVYGAVKQNNGFIFASSEPGRGTTFTIHLPRSVNDKKEPEPGEKTTGAMSQGQETILLVEDEPTILTMTSRILERQGYTVLAASTPEEAISLARQHRSQISLLLTDVIMPEMNGRDLAEKLLTIHPDLKRIFMSGYTADVISASGVLDKGVHFIQKPFTMTHLAAKVREALDSH